MATDRIESVDQLERLVGKPALGPLLKSIDALDVHCRDLLAASPFAVIGATDARGFVRASPLGGEPGFAAVLDERRLWLPDDGSSGFPTLFAAPPHDGVAALFLIPGLGETLRVNGRARPARGGVEIAVDEAFIHCAKALIRSKLWDTAAAAPEQGAGASLADPAVSEFLARSPFIAIASADAGGAADVSPKGDPPGFALVLDDKTLAIPDRPGNQRFDTYHNLVTAPRIGLLALVPGEPRALAVSGRAAVSGSPELCARMVVAGKAPRAALLVEVEELRLEAVQALASARLWEPGRRVQLDRLPRISEVLSAHVKSNKRRGVVPALMRTFASEGVIERGLEKDYERRLY